MASRRGAGYWPRSRLPVATGAARVVVAVPVAPAFGCSAIRMEADEVISVEEPESFLAVSQWYRDFTQVSDQDVQRLLASETSMPRAA